MHIGIIGHEAAKFTPETKQAAIQLIEGLVTHCDTVVSGHCHLGGIDIWAEEVADSIGAAKLIFPPKARSWNDGYKPRNIQIAKASDIVHVIVVATLPSTYTGMRFSSCYHCGTTDHVKSGACWTARYAIRRFGKSAIWHII